MKKISQIFCLLILQNLFSIAYATAWPIFTMPDQKYLLTHHFIDTRQCPKDGGEFLSDASIDLREFCKTYCPSSWKWMMQSDGRCHHLSHFKFKNYEFIYQRDSHGAVNKTTVIANFGEKNKLIFTTPNEHWYCYENNHATHTLICANDI